MPANRIYSNVNAERAQAGDGTVDDRICGIAIMVRPTANLYVTYIDAGTCSCYSFQTFVGIGIVGELQAFPHVLNYTCDIGLQWSKQ
jgi:hypothetical protein